MQLILEVNYIYLSIAQLSELNRSKKKLIYYAKSMETGEESKG